MKLSEFDYELPAELIAQQAVEPRDASRLLFVRRRGGRITHHRFDEILSLLPKDALLVMNNSKVFPARILCRKDTGAQVEVMLTRRISGSLWHGLLRPARKIPIGTLLNIDEGKFQIRLIQKDISGIMTFELSYHGDIWDALQIYGKPPLPPYIYEDMKNPDRYQTVYAEQRGSVAAPTAGLHFTQDLLARLAANGIDTVFITLHVGPGTFRPVKCEQIEQHQMDEEFFTISETAAEQIVNAKRSGRKIIAVGTTSVRTLESAWSSGRFKTLTGQTNLFIYPGFQFSLIDGMITNFHLPKSTLLMLTATFAGQELLKRAYQEAVRESYRFYSLGDAMLIL